MANVAVGESRNVRARGVLWRRHWPVVIVSVPLGSGIGLGVGMLSTLGVTFASGPPDWIVFPAFWLGAATAAAALLGAIAAALSRAGRTSRHTASIGASALGAGVGAVTLWVSIGLLFSTDGLIGFFVAVPIGIVCGLASAGIAALSAALPLPARRTATGAVS